MSDANFNNTNKKASTAASGASSVWQFDSSTTMSDPGDKKMRLNNADPTLATQMAISVVNANDLDVTLLLSLITINDVVLMKEAQDSSRSEIYSASANPTDNTSWFLIPLTFADQGTGGIRTGKDISITFIASDQAPAAFSNFDANDAIFPSSDPAAADSRNGHPIIAFDDTVAENIVFSSLVSEDYKAGNIFIDIDWVAETAITGGVTWGIEIERNDPAGNNIDSDAFATQQTANSTTSGTSGILTRTTIPLTQVLAASIEAGDSYRMRLERVVGDGGDDMVGDAQVLNVTVRQ